MNNNLNNARLLPFTVIQKAAGGDVEAINTVLKHYAGYIAKLSLRELYDEYGIRIYKTGYDVKFSKEFLRQMDFYGFETEIVIQNKITLSNPTKLVEADLMSKLINYNENPIDRWCLGNAALEVDSLGNVQIVKGAQASRRIDGAVTLAIVYEMYRRYRSDLIKLIGA